MRNAITFSAVLMSFALALPALAQTTTMTSVPGKVTIAQTAEASARITAIDTASRTITLTSAQGDEAKIVAGPEVRNFAQLKVGDAVKAAYVQSLVLELKKGGGMAVEKTEKAAAAGAAPGATPEGLFGRQVTIVGDIVKLDAATQTITVKGPQRTVDLKARDPAQFKLMVVGDQLQGTYTEALAVSVTPVATAQAPAKK